MELAELAELAEVCPTMPIAYHQSPVLGTCTIFSATATLARTKKGGACRSGTKVKKGLVAVAQT